MSDSTASRFASYAALAMALLGVASFGLAIVAVPVAGANCNSNCVPYPYMSTAGQWPHDFLWMPPAICFVLVYLMVMACIHQATPDHHRMISLAGLCLAAIAAAILAVDYYLQFTVVPVSLKDNETNGLALLIQYNPHGLFIALEELGYLTMSVSMVLFSGAITGADRLAASIRWIFRIPIVVGISTLAALSVAYGLERQDRFEIVILSACWLALIVGGFVLAALFWTMEPPDETPERPERHQQPALGRPNRPN